MSNDRRKWAREIFCDCLKCATSVERDEVLRRKCAGDTALESAVLELLEAHEANDSFLERPLGAVLYSLDPLRVSDATGDEDAASDFRNASTKARTLGDYRLLREIARGGMGVVYEAEQISLNRRVALKVLPFAAMLDQRRLKRFQLEAQAAAGLHQNNIVPVFAVGCDRGVHFYAMQFIEGHTLAEVITELRKLSGKDVGAESRSAALSQASELASGRFESVRKDSTEPAVTAPLVPPGNGVSAIDQPGAERSTDTVNGLATDVASEHATNNPAYFRTVARFGIQAAEALEYAHEEGVVHRDIKPGNLILDLKGKLWITDFGLARMETDANLTMTGDLAGTLRYMSPEQTSADRVLLDHRTDVYSLGATLYEMLTLQPAVGGKNRAEILRRISFEEPVTPRRIDKNIPADLETIILKAMAKSPDERYGTAQKLGDDLRRYLEHKSIWARRPTLVQRVRKWTRRHVGIVWVGVCSLAATIIVLAISVAQVSRAYQNERNERTLAKDNFVAAQDALAAERAAREDLDWRLYITLVNEAFHELEHGSVARAEALLQDCPPRFRDWEWHHGKALCNRSSFILAAAQDPESGTAGRFAISWKTGQGCPLAFSPHGRRIAACQPDGAVLVWDVAARKVVHALRGTASVVNVVAFSPDGRLVATGSEDRTIRIWNAVDGKLVRTLSGHAAEVVGLAFGDDGGVLVSTENPHAMPRGPAEIIAWEVESGLPSWRLRGRGLGNDLAFDSVRHRVAIAGGPRIRIRNLDGGSESVLELPPDHGRPFFSHKLAFSPVGSLLAVGSYPEGAVQLWNLDTRSLERTIHVSDTEFIRAMSFDKSGESLAVVTNAGDRVTVWETETGELHYEFPRRADAFIGVAFSPVDDSIAALSSDGVVEVWPAGPSRPGIQTLHNTATGNSNRSLTFSPDSNVLAVTAWGQTLLLDAMTGQRLRSIVDIQSRNAAFSPDGKRIAVVRNGRARVLDVASGTQLLAFDVGDSVSWIAFSPDGGKLATTVQDSIGIWDATTGERLATLTGSGTRIGVSFSPDGKWVGSVGLDGVALVWSSDTNKIRHRILCESGHTGENGTTHLAFSPASDAVAVASDSGSVIVSSLSSGEALLTLQADSLPIFDVAYAPSGTRIASVDSVGVLRLWDAKTGDLVLTVSDLERKPSAVAFSPDGLALAMCGSGAADRNVFTVRTAGPNDEALANDRNAALRHDRRLNLLGRRFLRANLLFQYDGSPEQRLQALSVRGAAAAAMSNEDPLLAASMHDSQATAFEVEGEFTKAAAARFTAIRNRKQALSAFDDQALKSIEAVAPFILAGVFDPKDAARLHADIQSDPSERGQVLRARAILEFTLGDQDAADTSWKKSGADGQGPESALARAITPHAWSWIRFDESQPPRVITAALRWSRNAAALAPDSGSIHATLGVAEFRAGNFDLAIEAFERSMTLRAGGDSYEFFFLAMAHQRLGHSGEAQRWLEKGHEWMAANAPDNSELRRFRAEAEALFAERAATEQPDHAPESTEQPTNEDSTTKVEPK